MIIVQSRIPLNPEDFSQGSEIVQGQMSWLQQQDGCVNAEVFSSIEPQHTLLVFQEWRSEQQLQDYFNSQELQDLLGDIAGLLSAEITTRLYAVHAPSDVETGTLIEEDEQESHTLH